MKEIPTEILAANDKLYEKLVPFEGKANTVEGEMLRAINRIIYRLYNDGDFFDEGYGIETAGPAHAYLLRDCPLSRKLQGVFRRYYDEDDYADMMIDVLKIVIDYVENRNGDYQKNYVDMLDCEPVNKIQRDEDEYRWS
jgi:hypothetical protein